MTPVYKLSAPGTLVTGRMEYKSMLAGNPVFSPSSYESIASYTISGTTTGSVTFTNIPQTFQHLQLRIFARSLTAATNEALYLYNYNNNAGSTGSATHSLSGDGNLTYANGYTGQYSSFIATLPAASSTASAFGVSITDILDYTNTNKNKTLRTLYGYDANGSGTIGFASNLPLTLPGTAAITTLSPSLTGGNYLAAGSVIALYGIKGA
jgi:hypothetical protein